MTPIDDIMESAAECEAESRYIAMMNDEPFGEGD